VTFDIDNRRFYALIAVISVLGAVLRVLAATPGFLGDELFTVGISTSHSLADVIHGVRTTENTPPLYYVLAWASVKATGAQELIRLPSLVAGIATIPVAALIGRRVFGSVAGVAAAALIAASPFAIFYSSEARAYAPAAFCVIASTLLLLRALERRHTLLWAAFAVLASAAVWFHYTAVFPLAAQAVWAFATQAGRRRQVVLAHLGAVALYVPWLPFAGTYVSLSLIARLAPITTATLARYPAQVLTGHPFAGLARAPGTIPEIALGLILVVLGALWVRRASRRPRWGDPVVLLAAMALAAPLGVLAYSALKSSIYLPRNLIVSAAPAWLLVGGLLARTLQPAIAGAVTAVGVALMLPAAVSTATGDLTRPPYDQVARLVDAHARPGDPVIEGPLFPVGNSLQNPLRRPLLTFLRRPHPLYLSDFGGRRGWRAATRAGRAFVVYPDTDRGAFRKLVPMPPRGSRLVPLVRRHYDATPGLTYIEYGRR
jgi:mannosyltransferase